MRTREIDDILRDFAVRQHGVASRAQLLDAGVGAHALDGRIKRGVLRPVHRGVYQIGPILPPGGRPMAAMLACGPAAVVSHGTAAELWRIPVPPGQELEVIDPEGDHRPPGVRVHRLRNLHPTEATRLDGIRLTTPERTLFDLAQRLVMRSLERAFADAYARRLTNARAMRRLVGRHVGEPGTRALRALLEGGAPALTRSEAEELFLALVREAKLPAPEANVRIAGFEVDFVWRRDRLVVEIDGRASHSTDQAFESDRRRDAILIAAGYRTLRFTWSQLTTERLVVLRRLVLALGQSAVS